MTEPFYKKCHLCEKIRAISNTSTKVLYGATVYWHYCAPCLGLEEEVIAPTEVDRFPDPRILSSREIKAAGSSPAAIAIESMTLDGESKQEINEEVNEKWGGFLRPLMLSETLRALVRAKVVEEAGTRSGVKLYRLPLQNFKALEGGKSAIAFLEGVESLAISEYLSLWQLEKKGLEPIAIVLDVIAKGSNTRRQINKAIGIRWGGCLRSPILSAALATLMKDRTIAVTGQGTEERKFYIAAKMRSVGGS